MRTISRFWLKKFPDEWEYLKKNIAHPYEHFNTIDEYQKPVDSLKKKDSFSKLQNAYLSDEESERAKELIKLFNIKNWEEITKLSLRSDVILLADVFEKKI